MPKPFQTEVIPTHTTQAPWPQGGLRVMLPEYQDEPTNVPTPPAHPLQIMWEKDGIRILLGDPDDSPNLLLEHDGDNWRLFVHHGTGDPICVIHLDGKGRGIVSDAMGNTLAEE